MAPEFGTNLEVLPLVPEQVLRKHHIHTPHDTRFRSAARLLQALWREDRGLPLGTYQREDGEIAKLGSRITDAAGRAGANFLTTEIATIARRELIYREVGAFIDQDRLLTNLLSSMPLVFNLFGPMVKDLKMATTALQTAIPGFDGVVERICFEHSPGRGDLRYTADWTAFDVLVRYRTKTGGRGFIAIEVKYSESMLEPVPPMKPRYDELTRASKLYLDPESPYLRTNPMQQLWREHLLAQSMVQTDLYDEGLFVLIAPQHNWHAQQSAGAYRCQLEAPATKVVPFVSIQLESLIDAIAEAGNSELSKALHRRYTDFWLVDGQIELEIFGSET